MVMVLGQNEAAEECASESFHPVYCEQFKSVNGIPDIPAGFEEGIVALLRMGGKIPETVIELKRVYSDDEFLNTP